jgi:pyrroloquinoline-quinone synthase
MSNELWAQVDEILTKYDLLKHPFYQAWTAGELTREQLAFYGRQYLQHVAAFPTYLTALHARLPEGATRRAILSNATDEEISGRSHADLWRQFISGMEPKPEAPCVLPEMHELVNSFREMATEATLPTALGAFYAYESQVPRVAETKLAGLKAHYGADDRTCEYFFVHQTADIHHSNVWRGLIDPCVAENSDSGAEVLAGVDRAAKGLWRALDGIEAARTAMTVK